ncbi:zinc finger BED domain-containing protein RICESLEEPER 2 [Tanacetum coccineum]
MFGRDLMVFPDSYLCVTGHWVDPVTWQMMKRTIAFENFEYPHTGRESQFPVLEAMARDLLSVQASTVALEYAFSTSGRVLSIQRTRLTPASLEMCICLKDHLDAVEHEAASKTRSSEAEEEDVILEQALN